MSKPTQYTILDKKIDSYLGTRNLRPGPPARLVNRLMDGKDNMEPTKAYKINYFSFSLPLTRNIPWTELTAVKLSDYGSETAYFLEFLNNKQLILKTSNDLPLYYFGSLMLTCYGIATPFFRLLEYSDPEFNTMLLNLERASHIDAAVHNKILFEVKAHPFVLLYEYLPSLSLFDIGENRANVLLNEKHFKSRELMINLGKMITLDIFLNNSKRIPLVWLNNGDPNNIIFKVNLDLLPPNAPFKNQNIVEVILDAVYGIDTLPYILNPQDKVMLHNLGDYMNTLNDTFKLLCYEFKSVTIYGKPLESFEFKSFEKLKSMIKNSTGYNLSPTNLFHIAMGMLIMINQIIETELNPIKEVINFVLKDAIFKDWADNYFQSANTLKIEYFRYLLDFFQNLKDDNDQIFQWIEDTTFGIYQENTNELIKSTLTRQKGLKYVPTAEQKKAAQPSQPPKKQAPYEPPKDFFNYNKNDRKPFSNDVHNGIYDIYGLGDDLIMELKERKYNEIVTKPPEVDPNSIEDKEEDKNPKMPIQRKLEIENLDGRDEHTVYTMEQLRNKVKKEELFDTYKLKKKLNPEEGQFLEKTIKEVDPNFLKEQEREKREREKKEKERKDKEARRLKQLEQISEENKNMDNSKDEGKSVNSSANVSRISDKKSKGSKGKKSKKDKTSSHKSSKKNIPNISNSKFSKNNMSNSIVNELNESEDDQ